MVAESHDKILIVGGTVAVAVGTYLPWLRTNPNLPPNAKIPIIYYTGMSAGFEGFDFALLGAVGFTLLLHGVSFRTPIRTVVTLVVGVGMAVFPVYYLSYSTLFGFSATFVPALGWYLTFLGGVLFSVAGGRQLPSVIRRPKATASLRE
ncbi:hypothetical protein HUG10_02860 [Halorarum halophilum]|uniref:Uncharacterized protein n=1 Tax=Halorarum halophilum TaxID=2743090 RepID=A0A7D5GJ08_9EURY|nr:hypothetical protein [Halobaculum halophilum]QLG26544.1 hypothetical protein HUG10_02860 [Halobaculum halophilum]